MKRDTVIIYTMLICIAGFTSYPLRPSNRVDYNYAKDGYLITIRNNQNIHYQVTQQILPKQFSPKALKANESIRYSRVPVSTQVPKAGLKQLTTEIQYATGHHKGYDFQSAGRILINPDVADEGGQTRIELFVDKGSRVVCRTIDATQSPAGSVAKDKAILFEDSITLRAPSGDPRKSLTRQNNPKYDPALVANDTPWAVDITISSIGYGYFSNFSTKVSKKHRSWKLDRPDIDSAFSTAYLNALYPHIQQEPVSQISATSQQPSADMSVMQQPSPDASAATQPMPDTTSQPSDTSGANTSDEALLPQYAWSDETVIVQDQPTDQLHLDVLDAKGRSKKDPLKKAEMLLRKPKGQYSLLQILSYLFQCENITVLSAFTKKYDDAIQKIFTNLTAQQIPQNIAIATTALPILKDVYRYARRSDAQQFIASIEAMITNAMAAPTPSPVALSANS